ncbi:hypothetical protein AVDCRST_MAG81-4543 [uncultured Synechococcales cyanobacterium]|uniref:Uncharacterized protein n=1 Tax=uncultured Synechococcales cyanobacterium TaxID=1936017 RepID=A0A6J4VT91_9CYAN|nr:hypothetical protein AVDCRST_MAG81-4543 [uncultured Synechococcales cyanobacterium]
MTLQFIPQLFDTQPIFLRSRKQIIKSEPGKSKRNVDILFVQASQSEHAT